MPLMKRKMALLHDQALELDCYIIINLLLILIYQAFLVGFFNDLLKVM